MSLLKSLARGGRTIIISIHQPSALLFETLDQLYVMAEGRCLFRGDPRQLLPFLSHSAQLVCPPYHNPADYSKRRLFSHFRTLLLFWFDCGFFIGHVQRQRCAIYCS
jgi:ABC-type multidrug transport system ATPase subunit